MNAGVALREIHDEPELTALRADARYHRLISRQPQLDSRNNVSNDGRRSIGLDRHAVAAFDGC